MKCAACDVFLNDLEVTRKSVTTGEYLDLCNKCFSTIENEINYEESDDQLEDDFDPSEDQEELR